MSIYTVTNKETGAEVTRYCAPLMLNQLQTDIENQPGYAQ